MRVRTWASAVAATGLLAAGAALPALAAAGNTLAGNSPSSPAEQHGMNSGNTMPDMGRMHEQMMRQMPEMSQMHEDMMKRAPGMARMQEQMMSNHARNGMHREDQRDEQ